MLVCAMLSHPLSLYAEESCDSSAVVNHRDVAPTLREGRSFRPSQIILPVSLIAVGTFGVYNAGFKHVNRSVRDGMDRLRGNHYFHADDYVQYVPVISYLGLDFLGVKARHSFKERLAVGATAYLSMASIVNVTKYSIKEPRPDTAQRNSFPSGHTATVFTGAELIRMEYGNGIGIGAYTVAVGVGFLRLYNGRHWLNDVVAGAGVGILSARIGYWMLPLYQKWFKWDRRSTGNVMVLVPGYNYGDHSFSINMAYMF